MREFNLLEDYQKPTTPRLVAASFRTIQRRIKAANRNKSFFDGCRNDGYGGYKYDGRWVPIAEKLIREYKLSGGSNLLHVNCEKGFLIHDIKKKHPGINVFGTETSEYATAMAMESVKGNIFKADPKNLPFPDNYFDCVIAIGVVYNYNLKDSMLALSEISRVTKKCAFVTLASYETETEYFLFKDWTLLGTTILKKHEWIKVLNYVNYRGDYSFTNAKTLNLQRV